MKIVAIGDIHGKTVWKDIINKEEDADVIVFVGDYFDCFESFTPEQQINNFLDIIEFKRQNMSKVEILLGNHDLPYYLNEDLGVSGYQPLVSSVYNYAFALNKDLFKIALQINKYLFSHAGVAVNFLDENFEYWEIKDIATNLNELFQFKPLKFDYDRRDIGGYGDSIYQTPLWIRPASLQKANKTSLLKKQLIQICGHTGLGDISKQYKTTGNRYYFIDNLKNGQYLVIEDNKIKIEKI